MSDTIANAAGQLGQATGATNIGQGVANLFSGGQQGMSPEQAAGAVMPSDSLFGVPMPSKTDIAPTPSPSFLQGFAQGFTGGTPGAGSSFPMSPGTQIAGGVGQLMHAISQLQNPGGVAQQAMVNLAAKPNVPSVDVAQNPATQTQSKPGLIDSIIKGLTYGILSSGGSTP